MSNKITQKRIEQILNIFGREPCDFDSVFESITYGEIFGLVREVKESRSKISELELQHCGGALMERDLEHVEVVSTLLQEIEKAKESVNPTRQQLRDLVDLVWNEATESTAVPSTAFADKMIDQIFDKTLDSKIPHGQNFVSLLTGDLDDKIG